jgi:hypothetical protein
VFNSIAVTQGITNYNLLAGAVFATAVSFFGTTVKQIVLSLRRQIIELSIDGGKTNITFRLI